MENNNPPQAEAAPNFDNMSDEELVAYLDGLREKNKNNQPVSRKAPGKKKPPAEKSYIPVDLD